MNTFFQSNNSNLEQFTFMVTANTITSLGDGITKKNTSQKVRWVMDGESAEADTIPSYSMTGTSPFTITIQTDRLEQIDGFNISDKTASPIIGHLDLSGLSGITNFHVEENMGLTGITFPTTDSNFSSFTITKTSIKDLDISGLNNLNDDFKILNCYELSSITFPNSSELFTNLEINDVNTIDIDISNLTNISDTILIRNNPVLTSITIAENSNVFETVYLNNSDLSYFDFYKISGGSSDDIAINISDNNMTAAEVNRLLYDMDTIGWTGGTFIIEGTNAAPDGASGGYDGTTAKTNLEGKSWSVFTN